MVTTMKDAEKKYWIINPKKQQEGKLQKSDWIDWYKKQLFDRLNEFSTKDFNIISYYKWHDDAKCMWFIGSAGVFYSNDLVIVTAVILNDWQGHWT